MFFLLHPLSTWNQPIFLDLDWSARCHGYILGVLDRLRVEIKSTRALCARQSGSVHLCERTENTGLGQVEWPVFQNEYHWRKFEKSYTAVRRKTSTAAYHYHKRGTKRTPVPANDQSRLLTLDPTGKVLARPPPSAMNHRQHAPPAPPRIFTVIQYMA